MYKSPDSDDFHAITRASAMSPTRSLSEVNAVCWLSHPAFLDLMDLMYNCCELPPPACRVCVCALKASSHVAPGDSRVGMFYPAGRVARAEQKTNVV